MTPTRRRKLQSGSLLLEERKSGPSVWVYRYWEQQDGKRHKRKVILGTADELSREKAERKAEPFRLIANRENPAVRAVTVNALIDRYLTTILPPKRPLGNRNVEPPQGEQMGLQCARSYRSYIERHIRPRWAIRENGVPYLVSDFKQITMSTAIEEWLCSLLKSDRNPSGLAPKTVRGIFVVMKLIFKFAKKWGYIRNNPMGGKHDKLVELPRGSTIRLKKPRVLTPTEFMRMLELFPNVREKLALSLAGWMGLRVSESFALKWRDIDFLENVVHFERGIVEGRVTPLKTEASRTELPLPAPVRELLLAWRCESSYRLPDDWVFASPANNGELPFYRGQLLKDHIQPVIAKAGMGKVGWHTFRHSYVAWGKAAGLEAIEMQRLARHQSLQTTGDIYGETAVEAKRKANQRIIDYVTREAQTTGPQAMRKEIRGWVQ